MNDSGLEINTQQDSYNVNLSRIEALCDVQRYQDAEKLVREQLASEPEDAYWLFYLARTQIGQDKLREAEDSLFSSLSCDPDYGWSYYLLSNVSNQLNNFTQELKCAKKAASLEPDESVFIQRLAEAHLQNGEIKQAKQALKQVIKLEPDSEEAFTLMGDIEFELDNFSEAEIYFTKALKFAPEDISLLNSLARSLMCQKKKLREAIDILFNIVQLDPSNKTVSNNLYLAIREWVDNNSFKAQGKKSLMELPQTLQYFYNDYKQRSSIFEAWGKFIWTFVWIGGLVVVTYLFSLVEQ